MSAQLADRPAKRAKQSSSSGGGGSSLNSARAELPSLLTRLNGGNALDPSVIAAIKAAESYNGASNDNPQNETLHSILNKLFADHVGKSQEIVLGNAIRHAKEEAEREEWVSSKRARGSYFGNELQIWLNHPDDRGIEGPRTDGRVWLSLFLGKEQAEERLKETTPINSENRKMGMSWNNELEPAEHVISRCLQVEVSQLSPVALLANILSHVRSEARKVSLSDLMRFSVLYGLDGVMKDVLQGHYGDAGELTINSLIALDDNPLTGPSVGFLQRRRLFFPAYAMGAIIGHTNITATALNDFGGEWGMQYGVQLQHDEEMKLFGEHNLPAEVFHWIFQKNMPDMIKCYVNECGFQFRWEGHGHHMEKMFDRIFEADEFADFPKWAGDLDEEDLMFESSRARRQMRAEAAYKEQMKMMDLLIELGFPFVLFFPIDPPLEREKELRKEKKLETRQECRDFMKSLTKEEKKARDMAHQACSAYNSLQDTEPETLTLGDYYAKLKSRWKGQESVQVSRLEEFEDFDSRWRQSDKEEDSESDYESGEGSSYDDPDF